MDEWAIEMQWPKGNELDSSVDRISRQYDKMLKIVKESAERAGLEVGENNKSAGKQPPWTPILTEVEKER